MTERVCSRCKEPRPLTEFNRDRTRRDGVYPQCKACSRRASNQSYVNHQDAHRARKQAWKDANRPPKRPSKKGNR